MFIPNLLMGGGRYNIPYSAMFDPIAGTYFYRNLVGPGTGDTSIYKKTHSFWIKRATIGNQITHVHSAGTTANMWYFGFGATDTFVVYQSLSSTQQYNIQTNRQFKDTSEWYHFVIAVDVTQAASADRVKIYVNGVEETSFASNIRAAQNTHCASYMMPTAGTYNYVVGTYYNATLDFEGVMSENIVIDGQQLEPTAFGRFDNATGEWVPIEYTGTFGTNGLYNDFSVNTLFGTDVSGNSHTLTDVGFGTDHQYLDTPTNNFCIMNDLDKHGLTGLREGGLYANRGGGTGNYSVRGTQIIQGGKWYFETNVQSLGGTIGQAGTVGITAVENSLQADQFNTTNETYSFHHAASTWWKEENGTGANLSDSNASGIVTNTKMCIAIDLDNGKMWVRKNNNTWVGGGDPAAGTSASITGIDTTRHYTPFITTYNDSGTNFIMLKANFGQCGGFTYTPPSGFNEIKKNNLDTPEITNPKGFYGQLEWTGDGNDDRSITGLEFQPDLVWFKNRSTTAWHRMIDSVRGSDLGIYPNDTSVELTDANEIQAFESGGIQIGTDSAINGSGNSFAAWCWKEGVTPGFDIVTYTGDGLAGRTVAHNLGVKPKFIIIKRRTTTAQNWPVYHENVVATKYIALDLNVGETTNANVWDSTEPDASNVTLGTGALTNADTASYVMYAFAEVPGFSKFGTYKGNGNADGPYIHLGFKPAIIIIKRTSTTGTWSLYDNYMEPINDGTQQEEIYIDINQASASTMGIIVTANGFKLTDTDAWKNTSAATYVFAAWAEQPYKYGRAV